ncbi:MAG: ATP-binding cassette domain-containing protein [Candidatus Lokiarchaeota archaeon]|nr:ATP-binding cassette domain-containing protein [Candidatus Lokiarchaeota archaeon]MBD3201780.1 ATP-binding cassette domain-containing protein [Candidatus Lokiarchaeota archaeon]
MSDNIIEVKNLTKIYEEGKVLAVDDISFNIKKGEIFALLGPNGAGKTTTISMLATLLRATGGNAIVNSHKIDEEPDMIRKSIGVVFQEPSLDGDMTGWENLELHAVLYGMERSKRRERINEVLELVNLEDKSDMYVKNYSGGMKRRLEIARGLIHTPQVLFLDEPTLGLDPQTRRKIWEKIKELNSGDLNMTILITTHYMEEADELADRICIMDHGKIIALDTSENLKKELSGDIIELELEEVKDFSKIPNLIAQLKQINGVKEITMGTKHDKDRTSSEMFKPPPGMKGINPEVMRRKINEVLSDPKKFLQAIKKFPRTGQFFLNAPYQVKEKVARMYKESELVDDLPPKIKEIIQKINNGEYKKEEEIKEPSLTISCEDGGKLISEIIQMVNQFNSVKIKTIHMHSPTLEDVFLFYTGSQIREESSSRMEGIKKHIQMRQLKQK